MRLPSIALLIFMLSAASIAKPLDVVVVRNAKFEMIKSLRPEELPDFDRHWSAKVAVEGVSSLSVNRCAAGHVKIDVDVKTSGGRWLYCSDGYTHILGVKDNVTVYKLNEPGSFNRLIGIVE